MTFRTSSLWNTMALFLKKKQTIIITYCCTIRHGMNPDADVWQSSYRPANDCLIRRAGRGRWKRIAVDTCTIRVTGESTQETGIEFNAVLLNLYRNGNDSVAWHSDKEHMIGKNPRIASVTFGQTRPFRLRHKSKVPPQLKIPLHHGTLLLMSGTTNTFWEHHIPKSSKEMLPRINLTFRLVRHN